MAPFQVDDMRLNRPLLALFSLINGLVLFNALFHFHRVGYDTLDGHMPYIAALGTLHLPDPETSRSFFSPPLPYVFPALIHFLLTSISTFTGWDMLPIDIATKAGQLQNMLFSLGLTFYLLKICGIIYPGNTEFKFGALASIGILPVYYKSFAFVRGEPLVAFLTVVVIYQVSTLLYAQEVNNFKNRFWLLGLVLGFLALSRQWGLLLFPSLGLWVLLIRSRWGSYAHSLTRTVIHGLCLAFFIGGWFYVFLTWHYGSPLAFNRASSPVFALTNQPVTFYISIGLDQLFSSPVYPAFTNHLVPVLFSETWGDYWAHFVYTRSHTIFSSSHGVSLAYLGRVNLVALIPTLVLISGVMLGIRHTVQFIRQPGYLSVVPPTSPQMFVLRQHAFFCLLVITILVSFGFYIWFLINYPNSRGDTIKATYILHIFPLLALLAGEFLRQLHARTVIVYRLTIGLGLLVFLHNMPVMITRFFTPLPFLHGL